MKSRSMLGIRSQIVALAVVPLIFLILSLVLVLVLARSIEQSAILSQRVAEIIKQSDQLSLRVGEMSLSLGQYARSYKSKDLALYDTAYAALPGDERTMESLVRGTALEAPAQRFVKATDAVLALFVITHNDVIAHREAEVRRLIGAESTKRAANELQGAKGAVSAAAASTVLVVNTLGRRNIANIERALLVTTSLGVLATILAALFLGLRTVRRLSILADNARRLSAGEAPVALAGNDEVAQLGIVYREMFERNVRSKARLEEAVRDYGELAARIAGGDLTARVALAGEGESEGDELAQLGANLNHMAASLERLVDEIRAAAASLASATSQILAATSQQVSSATEEAAAVRQTAATVLEVRQTAEMAARKTRLVAELAQRVEQTAESGRQSVEESVQSSEGARTRMVALAERILAFSEQAQMIRSE